MNSKRRAATGTKQSGCREKGSGEEKYAGEGHTADAEPISRRRGYVFCAASRATTIATGSTSASRSTRRQIKRPMLAVIEAVTGAMMDFAPGHVRAPESIMMRIYRDTRFSPNKLPYKTHVAAWWVHDGLRKTSGAGFYLHVSGKQVEIAAGAFMPETEQLLAIRRFLMEHHQEYRKLAQARGLRRLFTEDEGRRTIEPVAQRISGGASGSGALSAEAVGLRRVARAGDGDQAGVCEDGGELFSCGRSAGSVVESAAAGEGGEAAEAALLRLLIARLVAARALPASRKPRKLPQKL